METEGFRESWEACWRESGGLEWKERMQVIKKAMQRWANTQQTPHNRLKQAENQLYSHQMLHPTLQNPKIEEAIMTDYTRAELDLEIYWRQRSRLNWHCEGYRNTEFFHMVASHRKRYNQIIQVQDEQGEIKTEEREMCAAFVQYFRKLYCPTQSNQETHMTSFFDKLRMQDQSQIRSESHATLTKLPDEEEVRTALLQLGPDKSPRPDGITPRIYQQYWDIFKMDVTSAIQQTFATGEVPADWLRSNIVLIPKNKEPREPKDYRPITIGNTIYRLLMKVIANRLQPFMAQIISSNQSAFMRGRNIADSIIIIREIVHLFQCSTFKKRAFLFKADDNKAFHMLAWSL